MLRRSAKSKGNQFEYNVEYSLKKRYPDIKALEKRGFVNGYDLISDRYDIVIECKRHATMSWNELEKIYDKMDKRSNKNKKYVVFQCNRQPVLVFDKVSIKKFETEFDVPFMIRPKGYTKNENKTN